MRVKTEELLRGSFPTAILARLAVASILLLPLVIYLAKPIVTVLLPVYRAVFELLAGDYRILFLGFSFEGADSVIRMNVTLSHATAVAGHLVMANPQGVATVTIMVGNLFQTVMIGLIAVLTWPSASGRIVFLRMFILIFLSLVETILNTPLLLAGELWGIFVDNLSPESWSPLVAWVDFLQSGGRYVIGLMAAIISIAAAEYPTHKHRHQNQRHA